MKFLSIYLIITILLGGCVKKEQPPKNYPDFSTPEAAFMTSFYAAKYKDDEVFLDSLTEKYQKQFGINRKEQLANLENQGKHVKIRRNRKRIIMEVEYGNFGDYDVKIYYREMNGSKVIFRKAVLPLKKINNEWKVAVQWGKSIKE